MYSIEFVNRRIHCHAYRASKLLELSYLAYLFTHIDQLSHHYKQFLRVLMDYLLRLLALHSFQPSRSHYFNNLPYILYVHILTKKPSPIKILSNPSSSPTKVPTYPSIIPFLSLSLHNRFSLLPFYFILFFSTFYQINRPSLYNISKQRRRYHLFHSIPFHPIPS